MNFNNPDDFSSSPAASLDHDDSHHSFAETEARVDASESDEDDDLVEREETVTGVDDIDNTASNSAMSTSPNGPSSTDSSERLENSLRLAAQIAGTQGIEYDEHGDVSMEATEDDVAATLEPPVVRGTPRPVVERQPSSFDDQENINPFAAVTRKGHEGGEGPVEPQEQTMEMTEAVGRIQDSPDRARRRAILNSRRQSMAGVTRHRRSSGVGSDLADHTMEMTTAVGGILAAREQTLETAMDAIEEDEELSMEFTTVVGGVIDERSATGDGDTPATREPLQEGSHRPNDGFPAGDDAMDLTMPVGRILSPVTERTEPSEDTMAMDFTAAVGAILPEDLRTSEKSMAKRLMEEEVDHGQLTRSPFAREQQAESRAAKQPRLSITATEDGSPSVVSATSRNARKSTGPRISTTPKNNSRQTTPLKNVATPSKRLTPKPEQPTTPSKTPPSKNVSMRKTSPKRLFRAETKRAASGTPDNSAQKDQRMKQDLTASLTHPNLILTPRPRRVSGIGIDREGLGSPRLAEILDRRASIGEDAAEFAPRLEAPLGVRFEDPLAMQRELDIERAGEARRESGRGILEMEADMPNEGEKDVTANLRDMIQSLTPKKNRLKGRKSLHIGAAKGLLGKRPIELDEEDEEDSMPKRLKNDRSPVKNIKLPAPPSKLETTGRLGKAPRFNLPETVDNMQVSTPVTEATSRERASSPQRRNHFRDAGPIASAAEPPVSFNEQLAGVPPGVSASSEREDRIHLQDFLNMTSVRFMELNTTKRRHTAAPSKSPGTGVRSVDETEAGHELENRVVAGACTIPMLELYQHVSISPPSMGIYISAEV
jgi:kinetochore protein Spc7/SPC105